MRRVGSPLTALCAITMRPCWNLSIRWTQAKGLAGGLRRVAPRTGNISAGTSVFAMEVLEKPLSVVYNEIDMVTTPDGAPAAMVHCDTGTSLRTCSAGAKDALDSRGLRTARDLVCF